MCTPLKHPMENYFPPTQRHFFHQHTIIFICENLFSFMIICENLFLTIITCENLSLFAKIYFHLSALIFFCENLMIICKNLFVSMIICQNLFSCLYENKQVYEYHHLKQIFYHQNTIIILC